MCAGLLRLVVMIDNSYIYISYLGRFDTYTHQKSHGLLTSSLGTTPVFARNW